MQALFICPLFCRASAGNVLPKAAPYYALLPVFLANLPYQIKKFILDVG